MCYPRVRRGGSRLGCHRGGGGDERGNNVGHDGNVDDKIRNPSSSLLGSNNKGRWAEWGRSGAEWAEVDGR